MTAASGAVPVIAIDGPSASGKGTVAEHVARVLGFHYLDSGALYRLVALAGLKGGLELSDEPALAACARQLPARFDAGKVWLGSDDVTEAIRSEPVGAAASKVAAIPDVRSSLIDRQRGFSRAPGLVADGRDMGSVVFPQAPLKVFLTADRATRAHRRHKQLMEKGMYVKIADVVEELRQRDKRDETRPVAPLKHYPDAVFLDTTGLTAEQAAQFILERWRERVGS